MYFGRQDGKIMQADRTGYDDGVPWASARWSAVGRCFNRTRSRSWHQARAIFNAKAADPFNRSSVRRPTSSSRFRNRRRLG
jgi:hypothetical protein